MTEINERSYMQSGYAVASTNRRQR